MGANGTESTNQLARTIERARLAQDPYVEGLTLKDQTLEEGLDLTFFEFHALELEASSLTSLKCKKASFYDCTLTNCDLAGSDFTSAYFSRCRFIDCKLEGGSSPRRSCEPHASSVASAAISMRVRPPSRTCASRTPT